MHHGVKPGHIRARSGSKPDIGVFHQFQLTRIYHDKFCPVLGDRAPDMEVHYGMVLCRVAAGEQNDTRFFYFFHRIGHRSTTKCSGQTGHSRGVSESRAMIHIIGPDHSAHKFLYDVVFLISTFSRTQAGQNLCPTFFLQF